MTIFNDVDSALKIGMEVWVELADGKLSNQIIESLKISGAKSWIKFAGFQKREDADNFIGMNISIPRSEFAPLKENEIYLIDVIGFTVFDENRNNIGSVVDTMSLPAQNIIVVETKNGEVLIPFVDAHILLFDDKEKHLIVKNVEGLLN